MDRLQRYRSLTIACSLLAIIAAFSTSCPRLSSQAAKLEDPEKPSSCEVSTLQARLSWKTEVQRYRLYAEVVVVCGGQCGMTCRANAYLGPGQCRFVVTTCDRKRRFYGPTFTLPNYEHSALNKKG